MGFPIGKNTKCGKCGKVRVVTKDDFCANCQRYDTVVVKGTRHTVACIDRAIGYVRDTEIADEIEAQNLTVSEQRAKFRWWACEWLDEGVTNCICDEVCA